MAVTRGRQRNNHRTIQVCSVMLEGVRVEGWGGAEDWGVVVVGGGGGDPSLVGID